MYSAHNEGKCVIAEGFISTLKSKSYTLSIHIYSYICIDFSNEINNKDPKFKLVILLEY